MRLQLVAATILFIGLIAAPIGVDAQASSTVSGFLCTGYQGADCRQHFIPDAEVQLVGAGVVLTVGAYDESTSTDKGGYFEFTGVDDGEYTLTFTRAAFEDISYTIAVAGDNVGNYHIDGAEIQQTGSVTDSTGPVEAAYVYFYGENFADALSDGEGQFSTALFGGYYEVNVDQRPMAEGSFKEYFLDGTPLDLIVKDAPRRDIALSGTITDQNGAGVAGVRVNIDQCCNNYPYYQEEPSPEGIAYSEPYYYGGYQSTETDAAGTYAFKISEGWYNINAYKDGYANSWAEGEATNSGITEDLVMEKFPDKTAVIKGKIMDKDGNGLADVSISISNEKYGQYECSSYEEYAKQDADYEGGCKIIVNNDGTFEGKVMPGYSIISVYYDHWRGCSQSQNGDGSSSTTCGPNYYRASKVMDLQADTEHEINIRLQQRPEPDAIVSGYVLNNESTPVTSGQINFNRVDGYGYAWADLDNNGSYKLAVQSGYYSVSVSADGYFRWEGNLEIKANSDTPFDVVLTEGKGSYGYCCYSYGYAEDVAYESASPSYATAVARPDSGVASVSASSAPSQQSGGDEGFENLGGLGPYDKQARSQQLEAESEAPPLGLLFPIVGLLLLARRRQF
jgi:protocatechuate 3,4-dioxygenase beta subunit